MTRSDLTVRRRIAMIAGQVSQGQTDLLEGCRAIVRLRGSLGDAAASDPDLLVLVAVESELDDIPSDLSRWRLASEALKRKEAEKAEYIALVKGHVLDACQQIAARWGSPT